jgi:ribonuclease T2
MRSSIVWLALWVSSCEARLQGTGTGSTGRDTDSSFDFDFYVLAMSYQPEFCYKHKESDWHGCEHPDDFWKADLTLHGLWPQRKDGSWPSTCSNEQFNDDTLKLPGIAERIYHDWPNVRGDDDDSFWSHEWSKHGTCSGLSQGDYFRAALDSFVPTPAIVGEAYGDTLSRSDLLEAYGGSEQVVLVCDGKSTKTQYLTEVRFCVGMDADTSKPSGRIDCPSVVLSEGSCVSDRIAITKFPGDDVLVSAEASIEAA